VPPSPTDVSITSSNALENLATTDDVVTLEFTSAEQLLTSGGSASSVVFKVLPSSDVVNAVVALVPESETRYRATFTVGGSSPPLVNPTLDGLLSFVLTARDLAGNSVTATTAGSGSVTVGM